MIEGGEPCPWCARFRADGRCGRYHLSCVGCCARLVRSARPWKQAQEAMLAVIARQPGRPTKAQVLQALRELDAALRPTGGEPQAASGQAKP